MAKILSIGPDHNVLAGRNRELRRVGHEVRGAETRATALRLAKSRTFDLMLLCDRLLPAYAAGLADELKIVAPGTMVIILGGRATPLSLGEIQTMLLNQTAGSGAA